MYTIHVYVNTYVIMYVMNILLYISGVMYAIY